MSGNKKNMNLADVQKDYVAFPDPYKVSPPCRYNYRALVAYAEKVGKSINDLSLEEKAQFIEG